MSPAVSDRAATDAHRSVRRERFAFGAFALALIVYALAGSPTPDGFGPAELAVGGLLAAAILTGNGASGVLPLARGGLWRHAGWMLLAYGLTVPVVMAVARGQPPGLMVRDIVPFLFMLLPLFACPVLSANPAHRAAATALVAFSGIAFSVRLLLPFLLGWMRGGHPELPDEDPSYYANAPTVLFAAVACLGFSGRIAMHAGLRPLRWAAAFGAAGLAVPCILAMAATMQRATLGLMALSLVILFAVGFARAPLRMLPLILALAALAIPFHESLGVLTRHLLLKTEQVGFNNRLQEAAVVFDMLKESPLAVLFGFGWGQTISSPAVGDVTVNYTHTMLSALWLKTGIPGVFFAMLYLGALALRLPRLLAVSPVLCLSIAAPAAIDAMLYASYKSLDFGLVLMLIPLWTGGDARVAPRRPLMYSWTYPDAAVATPDWR